MVVEEVTEVVTEAVEVVAVEVVAVEVQEVDMVVEVEDAAVEVEDVEGEVVVVEEVVGVVVVDEEVVVESHSALAKKVLVENHRFPGIFVVKGKQDAIATLNGVPGESVYGEKRMAVDNPDGTGKTEYRIWNPFRSKLGATVVNGVTNLYIGPGSKVLYLGAASGTTVSHVSDLVGPTGIVYAVEFSHRSGRDLIGMAKKRTNVIPIIEDARKPQNYRMLVGMVDTIFSDVAQPDQARICILNAESFLKPQGNLVISIKANCIDSTAKPEAVFAQEVNNLKKGGFKPYEQITLEPFERDHAVVIAGYLMPKKKKKGSK